MIYTVRRFSQTTTQKEFGWIRDRLQKTVDKEVDKRNKYLNHLDEKTIKDDNNLGDDIISDHSKIACVFPKDKFMRGPISIDATQSRKQAIRALVDPMNSYTEDDKEILRQAINRYNEGISDIYWGKSDGLEGLAHELGHIKNYNGNLLNRFIHKGAVFGNNLLRSPKSTNALLDVLCGKLVNWEERNASKKGYELLKKYGLSEEELKIAKENMNYAIGLYESNHKISWRSKLLNSNSKALKWIL